MTDNPNSSPVGPVQWWRGRLGVAVAGLLVIAVVVGIVITTSGDDATSTLGTTSTSTSTPSPSTVATTPTTVGDAGGGSTPGSTTPGTTTATGAPAPTTTRRPTASTVDADTLWPAYSAGWKAACRDLWNHAPNGQMYDPDDTATPHPYADCLEDLDPMFQAPTAQTPAAATAAGRADALQFASLMSVTGLLCWLGTGSENFAGCIDPSKPTTVVPPPSE